MSNLKVLKRWFVLFLAVSFIAASCGGSDSPSDSSKDSSDGTTKGSDAGSADAGLSREYEGETISVMGVRGEGETEGDNLIGVLQTFTEQTGIEVKYEGAGDQLPTLLSTRIESGSPPDVALVAQPGLLRDLVELEAAQDVSDVIGPIMDENYKPIWRELGTVDGALYGVYFKGANKSTVFHRVDKFAELGIEAPTNLEEWEAVIETSRDNGLPPFALGGANGWTLTDWFENVYVRTAGKDKYNQLIAREIPWTDDSVKEAFAVLEKLIGVDENVLGGRQGGLNMTFEESYIKTLGADAEALMVYEGDFVAGLAQEKADVNPGVDFDFFSFPSINDSAPSVVGGGDAAVALTDNPAALELLKFMASVEFAESMILKGGFTSPNQNVDLGFYADEVSKASAELLVAADVFVFDLSDSTPAAFGGTDGKGFWAGMQNWLADPSSVDTVLEELEKAASESETS